MKRLIAVASIATILVAGCSSTSAPESKKHPTPLASPSAIPGTTIIVASGHGWDSHGLFGPVPLPNTCRIRHDSAGEPIPDPSCTPGAIDSKVSDSNIKTTICRPGGYTASVRPPVSLTDQMKKKLLAAYGIPASQSSNFELDHFVALNDGGASDVRNLWPEPNNFQSFKPSAYIHNDKDAVEDYTYQAICAGKVKASAVQRAMAADWGTAVAVLGLPAIPPNYKG